MKSIRGQSGTRLETITIRQCRVEKKTVKLGKATKLSPTEDGPRRLRRWRRDADVDDGRRQS